MSKRILIIAGEASGDQHGAALVSAVHKLAPNIDFLGMGGNKMRAAGVDIRVDAGPLAVVGAIEVLRHIRPIYQAWKTLRTIIRNEPLNLIILIDYPTFNLHIAKLAKKFGIKILYYISPQVWAWHRGRIKTIGERIDKMLVVFPFEEALYREKNIPVEYVGHPLAGTVYPTKDAVTMRREWQIDSASRVIGLLPGSRKGEIKRLLPVILATAAELKQHYPDLVFVLPLANSLSPADVAPFLSASLVPVKVIPSEFYNTVQLCSAAIVASGTATLEVALLGVPMVIIYKTAPSTYFLAKRLIKIPYIGLCNIVADKLVVKEFIQDAANSLAINAEMSYILDDEEYRNEMKNKLGEVKEKLGEGGGVMRAAQVVLEILP